MLLPAQLAACAAWHQQEVSPQEAIRDKEPDRVRVTLADGTRREYWEPRIEADTLRGFQTEPASARYNGEAVAEAEPAALADVTEIEIRQTDTVGTVVGISLVVVVGGLIAAAYALSQWEGPFGGRCWAPSC
jgi:hypothetical protein